VTQGEIESYFAQIPVWMKKDILREINLARATEGPHRQLLIGLDIAGGGNLLAGLGLVSYTEALGRIRLWNRGERSPTTEECFLAFFDAMDGGSYQAWRLAWEAAHPDTTIYETLRCGLVHEYQPKVNSAFFIGDGAALGLAEENGELIFNVEPYHRHFSDEVDRLHAELRLNPAAEIPPPQRRKRPPPGGATPPSNAPTTRPSS
jgi:hypothetical protein